MQRKLIAVKSGKADNIQKKAVEFE